MDLSDLTDRDILPDSRVLFEDLLSTLPLSISRPAGLPLVLLSCPTADVISWGFSAVRRISTQQNLTGRSSLVAQSVSLLGSLYHKYRHLSIAFANENEKNNQILKDQCPVELFTSFDCDGGVFASSRDLVCHTPIIHNIVHLSRGTASFSEIIWEVFQIVVSCWCERTYVARPSRRRPKSLPVNDLRQQEEKL